MHTARNKTKDRTHWKKITIDAPVIYMEWGTVIKIQVNPLQRPLEEVGPEN